LAVVTTTLIAPGACAGVVAWIVFAFCTVRLVAGSPPKVMVAPGWKLAPVDRHRRAARGDRWWV